jgi:CBS domain-containing protein
MKVSDTMTRDVRVVRPDQSIREAADVMLATDVGALPVRDGDRLIGVITDRDIAIRAVAQGKSPDTPIRNVMTEQVCYCFDDQDVADIARNMAEIQLRRLPVVDRDKRLVGIVSIADIALSDGNGDATARAMQGVSKPAFSEGRAGAQA